MTNFRKQSFSKSRTPLSKKKTSNYIIVNYEIRKKLNISINEYCIFFLIYHFPSKEEGYNIPNNNAAKLLKLSPNTIGNNIKSLEIKGIIYRNSNNEYFVANELKGIFDKPEGRFSYITLDKLIKQKLNLTDLCFIQLVDDLSKKLGYYYEKKEKTGKLLGLSSKGVSNIIKKLVKMCVIEVKMRRRIYLYDDGKF